MRRSLPWLLLLAACGGPPAPEAPHTAGASTPEPAPPCTGPGEATTPLPRVDAGELDLDYWLRRTEAASLSLDEVLLDERAIEAHDVAVGTSGDDMPFARTALSDIPPLAVVMREVDERLAYMRERLESGVYVLEGGTRADAALLAALRQPLPALSPEHRVTTSRVLLRCGPVAVPFYSAPPVGGTVDPAFDRNACSTIERQELVQVLARYPDGALLVRTRYALGWLDGASIASLSPAVSDPNEVSAWSRGVRARALSSGSASSEDGSSVELGPDVLLPVDPVDATRVLFADGLGVHRSAPLSPGLVERTRRPLTRRAFLMEAFRHLGEPYGWGGVGGGLDCSELVMDVLATFDLDMPRHSARQAEAGSFSIPVPETMAEADRLALLNRAAEHGIVLLHFPGHVMIYLGRNEAGQPRILHSFAEYVEPCGATDGTTPSERLVRVNRVSVSDLELGRGTSRRAFIERLTRIIVLGTPPDGELGAAVERRVAAPFVPPEGACDDSVDTRIVVSPARPFAGHPLRVIVTATERHGAARLQLVGPDGALVTPEVHRLGGPPYAEWVEVSDPAPGRWVVGYADGAHVAACDTLTVARNRPAPETRREDRFANVWEPRWRWEADTEALYAAFVEQLFDFPVGDERTWHGLSELLRDRDHNLLYDHLALNEDATPDPGVRADRRQGLTLVPDCADLPYFLRAYFAWKLRLPFAFRRCSRGRAGSPPTCGELVTNATPHEYPDDVGAFQWFATRMVGSGVHSASGRTAPTDDATDLYPVPLTREALRPGTVFADPYGHLLVLVRWVAPSVDETGEARSGILLGADAQPDGTIGRRTFWRGTFLFTPDTTDVGAGFKSFRPIVYDPREHTYVALVGDEIERAGFIPSSRDQYRGSVDDFYDGMEALIDPRPVEVTTRLVALIDALEESAVRRVVSIDNGEAWFREHPSGRIEMPPDSDIFLTEGPWEDYSTPSRDMRLLIAIDTVVGFPEAVRRRPDRFRIPEGETLETVLTALATRRDELLAERRFSYTRMDGSSAELSLAELVARAPAVEIGWNPNDCPEARWGAPDGSPEASTCVRHAPAAQRAAMERLRPWFHDRRRPVR